MTGSTNVLKPNWLRTGVLFAFVCLVAFIGSGRPSLLIATVGFAILSFVSFGWVSSWCMKHLVQDYASEFICSLVWLGIWSPLIILMRLPSGWMVFGIIVAMSGYMLLIESSEPISYEDILNTDDTAQQHKMRQRFRLQQHVRYMIPSRHN